MLPKQGLSMKTKDHSCNVTQVGIVNDQKPLVTQCKNVKTK